MKRLWKISIAALFCFSASLQAGLTPCHELFNSAVYQGFKINPDGSYILAQARLDNQHQLLAIKSDTNRGLIVFQVPANRQTSIDKFGWIDNNTAYVQYENSFFGGTDIIEFTYKSDGDFEADHLKLPKGVIVDPMEHTEDKALFASANKKRDGLNLYKVNVHDIAFNGREAVTVKMKDLKALNGSTRKIIKFYIDDKYQIAMIHQLDKKADWYSVWDENSKGWREIYRNEKSESTDGGNDNKRIDIFKPIAVLNDHQIAVISNIGRDKAAVLAYDFETAKFVETLYESPLYDISNAAFEPASKTLSHVFLTERGAPVVKYLKETDKELQEQLKQKTGSDTLFIVDTSADGTSQIVFSSSSQHPGKFHYYNAKSKKVRFLQNVMPDLHDDHFYPGEYLKVTNSDGKLVEGFLTVPQSADGKPAPLVVMPHGGPIGVQDSNAFDPEVQFLANRGYAVLKINFRGSAGYGKEYLTSGRSEFGRGIEEDIDRVVELTIRDPRVDAERIAIYGTSYGGYSALISAILHPEKYRAAISAFGITDLPLEASATNFNQVKDIRESIEWILGDLDKNHHKLVQSSPITHAQELNVPTLLIAGERDETATSEHTNRLKYIMQRHNKDVQFISYSFAGHGHSIWAGDRHQVLMVVDFLDRAFNIERTYEGKDRTTRSLETWILGSMYNAGNYVKKDVKLAEKYLRQSHQLGNDDAATLLRRMGIYDL